MAVPVPFPPALATLLLTAPASYSLGCAQLGTLRVMELLQR